MEVSKGVQKRNLNPASPVRFEGGNSIDRPEPARGTMRRVLSWLLGLTLVAGLLHTVDMLHVTRIQQKLAPNGEMSEALSGQYVGWCLTAILVSTDLVLLVLLSRAMRKE
jgi:hypothetical protein